MVGWMVGAFYTASMCQNTITQQSKTDESTPKKSKNSCEISQLMKSLITRDDHH